MFEQERMISRVQRKVTAEPEIMACFLSGSFGRRTEDPYSDLDFALIFENDQDKALAWDRRRKFTQEIMPYVAVKSFDASHVRPFFHIALYANGAKLDFRYESKKTLNPNPWDRQIRILKDSYGWVEEFQKTSSTLPFPQPRISSSELFELDQRFWIMYWDIVRQLARGDSKRPFTIYLEILYFTLPPVLTAMPENDPVKDNLIKANYNLDAQFTLKNMVEFLHAYLNARSKLVNLYSLQFPINSAFESEIMKLLEKLA